MVLAILTFDHIVAIAGIPLEDIVTSAERCGIVSLLPIDEVVAVPAHQQVGTVASEESIVTSSSIDGNLNQRGQVARCRERIVPAIGIQDELFGCSDVD